MLARFCEELLTTGEAVVLVDAWKADEAEQREAVFRMEDLEADYRLQLPGTPPAVNAEALLWSARTVAWAATMLVDREAGDTNLPSEIHDVLPAGREPSTIYSVDFLLRFLPSLVDGARRVDRDDPLLDTLNQLATDWPLSGIGIQPPAEKGLCDRSLTAIEGDACLSALYVDRVIEKKDHARAELPWVQRRIREAVGDYTSLVEKSLLHE